MNRVDGNTAVVTPTAAVPTAPILITEQEVMLGTAAAMPMRPKTIRWWSRAGAVARAAIHRISPRMADGGRPVKHYPTYYGFLERSCMAREMDRL